MSATPEVKHPESWDALLDEQVKLVHSQIAAMMVWAGDNSELIEQLCAPYYELLQKIYREDFPIARAIECSDLVLRLDGNALTGRNPRISLIAQVFTDVRKQVGCVAYAISGISNKTTLPKDVDLGLNAFAGGSLYLGFSLPDPEAETEDGERNLLQDQDPLYKAVKEAIHALGVVSQNLDEGKSAEDLARDLPDPKVRDSALLAIQNLSPTGRKGISSVSISGREFPGRQFRRLTPETRASLRKIIDERTSTSVEREEFIGAIREVDLDLRRVELRRIIESELEEIRCIYPAHLTEIVIKALESEKSVRAVGMIERSADGKPRLLQIETIEFYAQKTGQAESPELI